MNDPRNPSSSAVPDRGVPHDDPRVTAFALGELDGDEAVLLEQALESDAGLRGEVEAVRAAALALREGFANEPAARLSDAQRRAIMRRPESGALREALRLAAEPDRDSEPDKVDEIAILNTSFVFLRRTRWLAGGLLAAAVLALAVTAAIMFTNSPRGDEVARASKTETRVEEKQAQSNAPAIEAIGPRGAVTDGMPPPGVASGEDRAGMVVSGAVALDAATLRQSAREGEDRDVRRSFAAEGESGSAAGAAPKQAEPPPSVIGIAPAGAAPAGQPADAATGGGARGSRARKAGGTDAGEITGDQAVKAGEPAEEADKKPASRVNRPSRGAAGDDLYADTAPVEHGRLQTRPLSPRQIETMDEDQLRRVIEKNARMAQQTRDRRLIDELERESDQITLRLKDLRDHAAEEYARLNDNPFVQPVGERARSTFAADVDTASYSNIRRFLSEGELPPADAVRIEEMVNYFRYDYQPPSGDAPFSANIEVAPAPWNPAHRLVRIGLLGKEARVDMRPATSLVFLVDVSGSMRDYNKLPLVKQSLMMLVRQLNGDDRLGIVTYAGQAGVALDSCYVNAENRERIEAAIEGLTAGGSTNGAGGIVAAYDLAKQHFITGGINRVILCTDGDFNVGVSSDDQFVQLIEKQRESGVFLSVLGFGTGNLKEAKMEALANKGNGQFAYIDSVNEAKKVLVADAGGTLVTIAKDVKLQVQFNDQKISAYRLIGYENRMLANADFDNDRKDAGEIGSGHTMTALYEIVPTGVDAAALLAKAAPPPAAEPVADQREADADAAAAVPQAAGADVDARDDVRAADLAPLPLDQLLNLSIRYKQPDGDTSSLLTFAVKDEDTSAASASADFRFAAAVAEFGMLLRRSPYRGSASYANVLDLAEGALGEDRDGYRRQFMELVRIAQARDSD